MTHRNANTMFQNWQVIRLYIMNCKNIIFTLNIICYHLTSNIKHNMTSVNHYDKNRRKNINIKTANEDNQYAAAVSAISLTNRKFTHQNNSTKLPQQQLAVSARLTDSVGFLWQWTLVHRQRKPTESVKRAETIRARAHGRSTKKPWETSLLTGLSPSWCTSISVKALTTKLLQLFN